MCGLIAIIDCTKQGFYQQDVESLFMMLQMNSFRGMDSTGVAGLRRDKNIDVMKVVGPPTELLQLKQWKTFSNRVVQDYRAVLGHGRFATKGDVTPRNAHPFQRGDITLIHNGTLTNFHELKNNYKTPETFEVDSDVCANLIHDNGAEAVSMFEGAFAFIWHDAKDNKIRAIRNIERPDLVVFSIVPYEGECSFEHGDSFGSIVMN